MNAHDERRETQQIAAAPIASPAMMLETLRELVPRARELGLVRERDPGAVRITPATTRELLERARIQRPELLP